MRESNYILIPVSLCQHSLEQKRIREFQVFMALKLKGSSGQINWTSALKCGIAKQIGVSIRSVEQKIKRLLKYNWIGRKKRIIYLRSFNTITLMERLRITGRVLFVEADLKTFMGFNIGAFIGYLLRVKRIKTRYGSKEARKRSVKTRAGNSIFPASTPYLPFANDIIRKIIGCSISTASRYKKLAKESNYISVKPNFENTNIASKHFKHFKQGIRDNTQNIQIRSVTIGTKQKKNVVKILPDLVLSNMYFKKKSTK